MPFAGYKDFAACVAANKDKGDPKGYCAEIMRRTEHKMTPIAKIDEDQNLVFGWFSVAVKADGAPVVDRQNDIITTEELEGAAYDFVLQFREADERHRGVAIGQLVESMMFTKEKMEILGIPAGSMPEGWWGGFKLDDATFAKVKKGDYGMFSIEVFAIREAA